MKAQTYFVTGIGTDVGKTIVSAIFCEALEATYWKPIQAGDLENSDSIKIKSLCSEKVNILPELFRLKTHASPHYAAELDNVSINAENFVFPTMTNNFIIEGAGGLMVPINNDGLLYVDILKKWKLPVILVSRHYLGSINHTLMSLEILKQQNITVELLVFVGDENKATETSIEKQFPDVKTHRIPFVKEVSKDFVTKQAEQLKNIMTKH